MTCVPPSLLHVARVYPEPAEGTRAPVGQRLGKDSALGSPREHSGIWLLSHGSAPRQTFFEAGEESV